jgi:hypothetical protein
VREIKGDIDRRVIFIGVFFDIDMVIVSFESNSFNNYISFLNNIIIKDEVFFNETIDGRYFPTTELSSISIFKSIIFYVSVFR